MSKCVNCGKENHNGCDVCDACMEESYYEQKRAEEEAEQEQRNWERRMEEQQADHERLNRERDE